MKKYCIVFTIDCNYIAHLAAALSSFLRYHDTNNVVIGLLYSNIDDIELRRFVEFFRGKGLEIVTFSAPSMYDDIPVSYHFNEVIFYRLSAPEVFSKYSKILYLDSDIIFLDNIFDLFEIDVSQNILAAIDKTPYTGVPPHMKKFIQRYFASGLLLIDTFEFNSKLIREKCLNFLSFHYYQMPDQDALNFAVPQFMGLDPSYGVETAFLGGLSDIIGPDNSPKIIQFSGSSKPWHLNDKHLYKSDYWRFRNMTPYSQIHADDLFSWISIARLIKNFAKRSLSTTIAFFR